MQNKKVIRNALIVGIIAILLGATFFPAVSKHVIQADFTMKSRTIFGTNNTLYVGGSGPNNYTHIQDAIDNASDGDTVFVYDDSSPYYENIEIYKSINLIGENRDTTIIDGNESGDVVYITADLVNINGFTIRNGGEEGIYLINSNYCKLSNNIVHNNADIGILLNQSENNTITNNMIHNNTYDGILLEYSNYNTITRITTYWNGIDMNGEGILLMNSNHCHIANNTAHENGENGIILEPLCKNNAISNNTAYGNNDCGILLSSSCNFNIIKNNEAYNNTYDGILIEYSQKNSILNNTIHHNLEDGICLLYCSNHLIKSNNVYNNGAGIALYSSNESNIGNNVIHHNTIEGIVLWNSNSNIVGENDISSNQWGIENGFSSCNYISNNKIFNNHAGIEIDNSTNVMVMNNSVYNSNDYGIEIVNSSNTEVVNNHVFSTVNNGIDLWYNATENVIRGNWVENNDGWGIELGFSSNNLIYNNYFNDTNNAWDNGNNRWNITKTPGINIIGGSYLGGNYWSDYTGVDLDGDGIGDKPYDIPGGNNEDRYPLIKPRNLKIEIEGGFGITIIITNIGNETISDINLTISLSGLIIFSKEVKSPSFPLLPNESTKMRLFVFGLGPFDISVSANDARSNANGFIIGPFVFLHDKII